MSENNKKEYDEKIWDQDAFQSFGIDKSLLSVVLGVIGLFIFPVLLGPMGLLLSLDKRLVDRKAKVGFVLGIINIVQAIYMIITRVV